MAGDKFDQLYNALKADGAVSGTREHFRQFVYAPGKQGYHNRKQLYDALHADGAVSSKSYEEFAKRLGLHAVNPKPQQQKPLTMKQRAQKVAAQYQQTKPFKQPKYQIEIRSEKEGFISHTDAEKIGIASVILGAGREKKGDPIDPSAGIILKKKTGDFVEKGQTLAVFHTDDSTKVKDAEKEFFDALTFSDTKPDDQKLIYKIIK